MLCELLFFGQSGKKWGRNDSHVSRAPEKLDAAFLINGQIFFSMPLFSAVITLLFFVSFKFCYLIHSICIWLALILWAQLMLMNYLSLFCEQNSFWCDHFMFRTYAFAQIIHFHQVFLIELYFNLPLNHIVYIKRRPAAFFRWWHNQTKSYPICFDYIFNA